MLNDLSIRRRLVMITVSLTLLIVLAVALIALSTSREQMRRQTISALLEHQQSLAAMLDLRMTEMSAVVRTLAGALAWENKPSVAQIWRSATNSLTASGGLISRLNVYFPFRDGYQTLIFDYPLRPARTAVMTQLIDADIPETMWFRRAMQHEGRIWHGPDRGFNAQVGTPMMSAASRLLDQRGQPIGVVWADLRTDRIQQVLEEIISQRPFERRSYSLLVNDSDIPITVSRLAEENDEDRRRFLNPAQTQVILELLPAGASFREIEGQFLRWDSAVLLRSTLPVTGWSLITALPGDLLGNPIDSQVLQAALVVLAGILMLAFIIDLLAKRGLVEPLGDLTAAAQEIGFGDLRHQISHQNRNDEIGLLARALEDMKVNLNYSYDELDRWSRALESRVAERTRELEEARQQAQSKAAELQAVYDASLSVISDFQLPVILQTFTERVTTLLPARTCAVWLLTSDKQHLQRVAVTPASTTASTETTALDAGLPGLAVREGQPIILEDYAHWPGRLEGDESQMQQALGVPLLFFNKPIGAVVAGRSHDDPIFTLEDRRLISLLANLVSPIVRNAQLYVRLDEAMKAAESANNVKTRFLASVSHELRTPLNLIINNLDFMQIGEFGPVNEEQSDRLRQTVRSAEQLLYLINDLLDVSKIEAGEMQLFIQPTDPLPVIEDALDSALVYLEKDSPIALTAHIPDNLPLIPMDGRRIRQVLMNLLTNAIKFTIEGEVELSIRLDDERLEFRVRDTGVGIAAEELEKLFQMFMRTEIARRMGIEGTGLGLAISRYLVEAHGGQMKVASTPGEGSTFSFTLPRHQQADDSGAKRVTAVMARVQA